MKCITRLVGDCLLRGCSLFMLGPKQCWTQPSCYHISPLFNDYLVMSRWTPRWWPPKCRNVIMCWDVRQPINHNDRVSTSQNQNMSEIHILHEFSHYPNTWLIKRPADRCTSTSWDCGISPAFGICWNWQIDEFLLNTIADVDDTCLIRLVDNAMPRYNKHGLNDKCIYNHIYIYKWQMVHDEVRWNDFQFQRGTQPPGKQQKWT